MREIEGIGILHKSDNDFNPNVVKAVRNARRAKDTRDLIDNLSGSKTWEDIEKHEIVLKEEEQNIVDEEER